VKVCKICNRKNLKLIKSDLPVFNHINYKKVSNFCVYEKCRFCKLISISKNKKISKTIRLFKLKNYSNSRQTYQKKAAGDKKISLYRSEHQAKYILKHLQKKKIRVLDIGCFDGKLLKFLDKYTKKSEFFGYDINHYLKKKFPKKKNFFFTTNLGKIRIKFDCIILSHSLQYIKNLKKILITTSRLIDKDGLIIIQVPDIKKNIFYSLMGDQYFVFTEHSLKNVCSYLGLNLQKVEKNYFLNEILLIFKKSKKNTTITRNKHDDIFEKNINQLKKIQKKIKKMFQYNQFSLLGTTINAAFVDDTLKYRVKNFLDENNKKKKKVFRGKKIIHPRKLKNNDNIILPYSGYKNKIIKKFKKRYKGNFYSL